jgi:hypothetical protein
MSGTRARLRPCCDPEGTKISLEMRATRVLVFVVLALLAVPLALYGAFAILYTGDASSPSETYVEFFGMEIDADVAGTGSLILALVLFA